MRTSEKFPLVCNRCPRSSSTKEDLKLRAEMNFWNSKKIFALAWISQDLKMRDGMKRILPRVRLKVVHLWREARFQHASASALTLCRHCTFLRTCCPDSRTCCGFTFLTRWLVGCVELDNPYFSSCPQARRRVFDSQLAARICEKSRTTQSVTRRVVIVLTVSLRGP